MIAVDTTILVYASRDESPHHGAARAALEELHDSPTSWAVPWPCWREFLSVTTNPRALRPPTPIADALGAALALADDSRIVMLAESRDHARIVDRLVRDSGVRGPKVHDARIAAICLGHGVSELWSADRDFSWFPELRVVNPLARRG